MKDARGTIEALLAEMRDVLIESGIHRDQVRMRSCCFKITTCAKAFDWLHDLYMSPTFIKTKAAYELVPSYMWERYRLHEIEDLPEQRIMAREGKILLKCWRRNRPVVFGKPRKNDNKISLKPQPMDTCRRGTAL